MSTILGCGWYFIFEWSLRTSYSFLTLDYSLTCPYRKIRLKSFFYLKWVWIFKPVPTVRQLTSLLYSTHTMEEDLPTLLANLYLHREYGFYLITSDKFKKNLFGKRCFKRKKKGGKRGRDLKPKISSLLRLYWKFCFPTN